MTSTTTKTIKTIGKSEAASVKATERKAMKAAKADPKLCECGCDVTTKGGDFLPGHDARFKGALLRRYDGGNTEAGRTLVSRGWATEEGLVARGDKSLDAGEKRAATRDAKIARLDTQIAALVARRDAVAAEAEPVND